MRHPLFLNLGALLCLSIAMTVSIRASQLPSSAPSEPLLNADASGEEIYRQACATCHGIDGTGAPQSVVGFELPLPNGHDFPDFTDCATNTVEPLADWVAVVASGRPDPRRSTGTCRRSATRCRPTRSSGPSSTSGPSATTRRGRAAT